MADPDAETDAETDHEDEPHMEWEERRTAPQTPYTTRDVAVGAAIALVGLFVTFGVPLLLL
jgi:hypothetical protein